MMYAKGVLALVIVLGIFGAGWKAGSARWETKYQALTAENWKDRAQRSDAARKALEGQLKQAHTVSANNAQVLRDLQDQTASLAADRDHARDLADRLLHRSCPARSAGVPEAGHQPGTPEASETGGDAEARDLLVAAHDECIWNADVHDALVSQLKPQL